MQSVVLIPLGLFFISGVQGDGRLRAARLDMTHMLVAPAPSLAPTDNAASVATGVPTVEHHKEPDGTYVWGSPLFEKARAKQKLYGDLVNTKIGGEEGIPIQVKDPKDIHSLEEAVDWVIYEYKLQFQTAWTILLYVIELIIIGLCGFLYWSYKQRKEPIPDVMSSESDFHYGFFDCGCRRRLDANDLEFFVLSIMNELCCCCCPCWMFARWADTASSTKLGHGSGIWGFWPLYATAMLLVVLGELSLGFTWLLVVALGVFVRHRIRKVYGIREPFAQTCLCDLLAWCCCSPCAVFQEARQVEKIKPRPLPPPPQEHGDQQQQQQQGQRQPQPQQQQMRK
eukprot:gnl/TRDRNA2_/TRDRNA2_155715_c4_seq4.p1 gnl/TRDRNA2_/TRDRNA2_155715_c4~~gnl/TRDRNA2_/TRDRNA2_155715_c4_seq4.p1  ORF type:complete len:340 (-),score=51.96 gnl/TRDRNA2_/TRDRNA2_155715_c4_seq4:56-1075(-)